MKPLHPTDHGTQVFYDDKPEPAITVFFPHTPCPQCWTDLRELRAWLDNRGLLHENTN